MNLIKNVFDIAEQFMEEPQHVWLNEINHQEIELLSKTMIKEGPPKFPIPDTDEAEHKGVLMELVASSINYCYWYGKSTVRPGNASSTKMYKLLMNSFDTYPKEDFETCLWKFIAALGLYRFPLIKERRAHLLQLRYDAESFSQKIVDKHESESIDTLMRAMTFLFPGFGSDTFLKRASLFFLQLHRRFGWFKDELTDLFVPADYQIPKMLRHFNCIQYSNNLALTIDSETLIPKHSLEECEIRAATIIAMRELCRLTGWNIAEVDGYFFLKRKEVNSPFHLTITTDY